MMGSLSSSCCEGLTEWADPVDMVLLAAEKEKLKSERNNLKKEVEKMKTELEELKKKFKERKASSTVLNTNAFSVDILQQRKVKFEYYTGFCPQTFEGIFKFLVPDNECPLRYLDQSHKAEINKMTLKNQLFFVLCKFRHNFGFQDLSFRFSLSQQACSTLFRSWSNFMFFRLGAVSIWPHRDVLIKHMPGDFKNDFPSTMAIIDCIEIKCQKSSRVKMESQTYSYHEWCNTLKGLVAVDPRGALMFCSMLFTGNISDKEIFVRSGFQKLLKDLLDMGRLLPGDAIMADNGFDIQEEVEEVGLLFNTPPVAQSRGDMSQADANTATLIGKYRGRVGRSIKRIKQFKILRDRVSLSLFPSINQIWTTCCLLINFMPPCIKYDDDE